MNAGTVAIGRVGDSMRSIMTAMPVSMPLHERAGLTCLIVGTCQAVSGGGIEGVRELGDQRQRAGAHATARSGTSARVPVFTSHSLSINVEFERAISAEAALELLARAPGVVATEVPNP